MNCEVIEQIEKNTRRKASNSDKKVTNTEKKIKNSNFFNCNSIFSGILSDLFNQSILYFPLAVSPCVLSKRYTLYRRKKELFKVNVRGKHTFSE